MRITDGVLTNLWNQSLYCISTKTYQQVYEQLALYDSMEQVQYRAQSQVEDELNKAKKRSSDGAAR